MDAQRLARVVAVIGALALVACGSATTPEVAAVPPTPYPTYTPYPTATPYPTSTAYPTYTPYPALTAQPTATATESPPEATVLAADASIDELRAAMLAALNQRRAEQGCADLVIDTRLESAAIGHAADIATRRVPDHRSADGSTLEQRLERTGYRFTRRSETIAAARNTSPLEVVDLWLDEPPDGPHRVSVLNCAYRDAGIGVARTDDDVLYWVVDYAQPAP